LINQGIAVRYAHIGIGEDYDYLTNLSREMSVADNVHFLGHVSPDDLPRWYNACDVFAMPNREINGDTEGFGMVFIEASACGKPAIGGRAGGTGAAIQDGVTGLRVDASSCEKVRIALAQILGDANLTLTLGRDGRIRTVNQFSWESVADKTISSAQV
jgi:phosphatidylinositol alpha-1,6-mannosyltransferase